MYPKKDESNAACLRSAVFLDRDGTLNVEKNYLYKIEDWEWIPGAVKAIQLINKMGMLAIIVTNQSGIARGYYQQADVDLLHEWLVQELAKKGAKIDGFYVCPHHPEYSSGTQCNCRKPEPGLLKKAARDFAIDLPHSYMIGDKMADVNVALKIGVTPILVLTGHGQQVQKNCPSSIIVKSNVLEAVKYIQNMNIL